MPEGVTYDQLSEYAVSEDGTQIAVLWLSSVADEGVVALYNLETSEPPVLIDVPGGTLQTIGAEMAFSPSGNFLLFAYCETLDPKKDGFFCKGANIVWFTTKEGEAATRWKVPFEDIGSMSFGGDGLMVMSAAFDRVLYNVDTGEALRLFDGHSPVGMFNDDGTLLLTNGDVGTFVWGIPTQTP
jgi:hypothetical protein